MDKLYEDIGKDMWIHDGFELVRILRLSFNVGSNTFFPSVQVKMWELCTPANDRPFWLDLSHYPQAPMQSTPY